MANLLSREALWTEQRLANLPKGEDDSFERKSGWLFDDRDFRKDLGKVLSAFANSSGGHIIIGVEDDGILTGVEPLHGRQPTREWLENIVADLTDYPLVDYRVQEVIRHSESEIPPGRCVLVIDVFDSPRAPHQCKVDRIYYMRQAGRSVPAPHFFVDLLRLRPTKAVLKVRPLQINFLAKTILQGTNATNFHLTIAIENTSITVTAERIALIAAISGPALQDECRLTPNASVPPILPGTAVERALTGNVFFRLTSEEASDPDTSVRLKLRALSLRMRAASDSFAGIEERVSIDDLINQGIVVRADSFQFEPTAIQTAKNGGEKTAPRSSVSGS